MESEKISQGEGDIQLLKDRLNAAQQAMNDARRKIESMNQEVNARKNTVNELFASGNISNMANQLEAAKRQFADLQKNLSEAIFTSVSDGGLVQMSLKGNGDVVSLKVSPEIVDRDDIETLEDFIAGVVSDGIKQITTALRGSLPI